MEKEILTFNDLPQVVAQLRDEVMGMRAMLTRQQAESSKPVKANRHKPMTVDKAIEYTQVVFSFFMGYLCQNNSAFAAVTVE